MLKIKKVNKAFNGIKALIDCSVEVKKNEIIGLVGPNAAGKSTLINVVNGLIRPDSGEVIFKNTNITFLKPFERYRIGIARTFQQTRVFYSLSVDGNIQMADMDTEKEEIMLKNLKLTKYVDNLVSDLSLGQQKLVETIRALSSKKELILLDEPFSSINPKLRLVLVDIIRKHCKDKTFIITDHDLDTIFNVCHRIIVMDKGKIIDILSSNKNNKQKIIREIYDA